MLRCHSFARSSLTISLAPPTVVVGAPLQAINGVPFSYTIPATNSPTGFAATGLPPGPICSPGEAALRAALYPESTDLLYFVARGDGTHVFSRTLADHERAIAQIKQDSAARR